MEWESSFIPWMTDTNLGKIEYLNLKVVYGAKSITFDKIRECLGKYKQDIRDEIFYSLTDPTYN